MSTDQTTSDERPDAQRLRRPASSSVALRPAHDGASSVGRRPSCATSASSLPASGASNKPMVPTAPNALTSNQLHPLRRHIGQPLGGLQRLAAASRGWPRRLDASWVRCVSVRLRIDRKSWKLS
jgi:hypothetical protein